MIIRILSVAIVLGLLTAGASFAQVRVDLSVGAFRGGLAYSGGTWCARPAFVPCYRTWQPYYGGYGWGQVWVGPTFLTVTEGAATRPLRGRPRGEYKAPFVQENTIRTPSGFSWKR